MHKALKNYCLSFLFIIALLIASFAASAANAAVPQYLGYEGYLTDTNDTVMTGDYDMTFRIYDALSGGNLLWSETHLNVSVSNGYFSVQLGSVTALTLDFDIPYWISFQLDNDSEMTPRQPVNAVGYANMSDNTYALTDADLDTTIDASTDDQIDIAINGADDFQLVANILKLLSGSSLETDTINETTAAAGVTIDNITLKDGGSTVFTGGTNTFNITNGTSSLDLAAGSALDVDANLTVESASAINQDLTTDASVTFAGLDMSGNDISNVDQITGNSTLITIGDTGVATGHSLAANDDLQVTGKLEVDGDSYFDTQANFYAKAVFTDEIQHGSGVNASSFFFYNDSYDQAGLALDDAKGLQYILTERSVRDSDFDHAVQTNPTLFIHSATDPDTDNTQWISFAHDQTNGVITSGAGNITLAPASTFGVDFNTTGSKVACSSTTRGQIFIEEGGAGVADVAYVCKKDAADAYAWGSLGGVSGDLDMSGNDILNVDQIIGNSTVITIGDAGTTDHSLSADDDLFVSGKLEVDGAVYFDGAARFTDRAILENGVDLFFGNAISNDLSLAWENNGTNDDFLHMRFGSNTANSTMLFMSTALSGIDGMTDHDDYTSPTFVMTNSNGADANDYAAVVMGERAQSDVSATHYFDFYAMTGAIDGSVDATTTEIAPMFRIGDSGTGTSSHSLGSGDVLIEDKLEVNGNSYVDGALYVGGSTIFSGNIFYFTDTSNSSGMVAYETTDELKMFLGSEHGRQLIIMDAGITGLNSDFDHDTPTNPTVFIHSATDPDTDNTQWLSLTHDQTSGVIDVGTGSIKLNGGIAYAPSSDQTLANDAAVNCNGNSVARVAGDGGAAVLDTDPAITDGTEDGQFCIIQGTSDANTVQIADAVNTALSAGAAFTLGQGDTLTLIWDSGDSLWYEISRSDN